MNKSFIKRDVYLNKVLPYINKDIIKVIIGQRRVGKSYILYQIMDLIKKSDPEANIIYVNKEQFEFDLVKDYRDLLAFIHDKSISKVKNYVFIDEVQEITGFEKALRDLAARNNYDLYCTGSNAMMLSSDLSTHLSGRYIEVPVYSLSFGEFLTFHKLEAGEEALLKYIRYGGLPYLKNLELKDEIVFDYLKNIYNTILFRDVVSRFGLRNINFLERLVDFVADNIGSLISSKKISDYLKSQSVKITPRVVLNYLSNLCSAFFIYKVQRIDVAGKKVFEVSEKYYFEDLGLRNAIIGYKQADLGKILENLVFSHLKFLGYKVYVGKLANMEIDFVGEKAGKKIYVQVAYLLPDAKTSEREFGNLMKIDDNYEKIVVSMDKLAGGDYKGIKHMHILEFLKRN